MTASAFITTQYIKDNSPILAYVNDDTLRVHIIPAQDMNLERVLGTKLFTRLKDGLINNNLNNNEVFLIRTYIQPALMYWVIYQYILWSNYKFTNKAVSKQNSDNSNPSDMVEVNYLKSNISDYAEYYSQRLTNYLKDYFALFPQYYEGITGYSEIYPDYSNYIFGGLYMPDSFQRNWPEKTRWDNIPLSWPNFR